jgi:ElaB/YqjD/DUF883 family membrane-anchored ribosome-binding protein
MLIAKPSRLKKKTLMRNNVMALDLSADDVVADLRKLVSEMETLLEEGGSKVKDRLGEAGSAIESRLQRAKKRLYELEHDAARGLKQTARSADRYAHDNPWQVSGAGLLTGVVLGIIIGLALGSRRD